MRWEHNLYKPSKRQLFTLEKVIFTALHESTQWSVGERLAVSLGVSVKGYKTFSEHKTQNYAEKRTSVPYNHKITR